MRRLIDLKLIDLKRIDYCITCLVLSVSRWCVSHMWEGARFLRVIAYWITCLVLSVSRWCVSHMWEGESMCVPG